MIDVSPNGKTKKIVWELQYIDLNLFIQFFRQVNATVLTIVYLKHGLAFLADYTCIYFYFLQKEHPN